MTESESPLDVIALAFEHAGVDAALIGGQAVNLWAEPRLTLDVDLVIRPRSPGAVERALATISEAGFGVQMRPPRELPSGPDAVVVRDPATDASFDIQTAKTPFQDEIIRRARRIDDSQPFRVATPEDLIVLKLIANRHKDQRDLIELATLPGLDWAYVEEWARVWQVEAILADLRSALEESA